MEFGGEQIDIFRKKYGAKVVGGLHIQMPDSVCDVKLLKKSIEKNQEIIKEADSKIENCVGKMKQGKYPKDGLLFYDKIAGLPVADIKAARKFYEDLFSLEVYQDYGKNIAFTCGLALQQDFDWLVNLPKESVLNKSNNAEIVFEEQDFCFRGGLDKAFE